MIERQSERAYTAGWSASMQWLPRVPPDGLSEEARELWLLGFDHAMDAPLGSGPNASDLMRVGEW